ncbi:MAG TPA: HupE/UreJ family protein [Leptolyngbyaceae cyanobacterium M65_K2018_010]|nr:HupE/UreJ family protein [Leptolyngbyaceae cyanobacterium M65_K2018_010]
MAIPSTQLRTQLGRRAAQFYPAILGFGVGLLGPAKAMAHHAMGDQVPVTEWQGFLSGLAHPVIGIDHLSLVIASGLLAIGLGAFWMIPSGFVMGTILGTLMHTQSLNLPLTEVAIAITVMLFGVLMATRQLWHSQGAAWSKTLGLTGLATLAGLFHGYAYGESIIGAETSPLLAYLLGFTVIQLAIALASYGLGSYWIQRSSQPRLSWLRWIGIGMTTLGGLILLAQIPGA